MSYKFTIFLHLIAIHISISIKPVDAFVFFLPSPGGGEGNEWYTVFFLLITILSIISWIWCCCYCCGGRGLCGASPVMLIRNPNTCQNPSKVIVQKPNGQKVVYHNSSPPRAFVPGSSYTYYGPQPGSSYYQTQGQGPSQQMTNDSKIFKA